MSHYDDKTYKFLVESWNNMSETDIPDEFPDVDSDVASFLDYILENNEELVYWIPSQGKAIISDGTHYEDEYVKTLEEANQWFKTTAKKVVAENNIQQPAYGISTIVPSHGFRVAAIGDVPDLRVTASRDVRSLEEAYSFFKEYLVNLAREEYESGQENNNGEEYI